MRADDVARLLRGHASPTAVPRAREPGLPDAPSEGFRFFGTRPDDPNDVVPHEHRRELRGLGVFCGVINFVDARGDNTLDTVIADNGRHVVRHLDLGSTFGSGAVTERAYWKVTRTRSTALVRCSATWPRSGSSCRRIATCPCSSIRRRRLPAADAAWDPRSWRTRTPNPAFVRMRADDAFWAARKVAAFSDDMLRALVGEGRYSDPQAAAYLSTWLMRRRDAIARTYLPAVNPMVDLQLTDEAGLVFANAAERAGVAPAPAGYEATWMQFDNVTRVTSPIGTTTTRTTTMAPPALPRTAGTYIQVSLKATGAAFEPWHQPVQAWFRRDASTWTPSDSSACHDTGVPRPRAVGCYDAVGVGRRRTSGAQSVLTPRNCGAVHPVGRSGRRGAHEPDPARERPGTDRRPVGRRA
jgi:hypothetical protein